jgi:hypothetical protein
MATRIYWTPPTPAADFYEVRSAPTTTSPFVLAAVVIDQRPSSSWDASTGQFYYDDPTGDDNTVYRVQGFLAGGLVLDTGIFAPQVSIAAQIATRTKVDHNYQLPDALRYIAPGGAGIPQAVIRVFQKPAWDAGQKNVALFTTETDDVGRWISPFWLEPGMIYVLTFEKGGSFGPDKVEITV